MENFIFCEVWVDVRKDIQPSNSARFVFINWPKKKFLDRTAKTGIEKRDYKVKILYTIGIILCEVLVRQVGLLRGSSGERKLSFKLFQIVTQSAISCSKLTIETLEQGVKNAQS